MNFKLSFALLTLLTCTSCATKTIELKTPAHRLSEVADYRDYRSYYLFGLFQGREVNYQRACLDQRAVQLRSGLKSEDVLVTFFTLGFYTSRTVEVWCEDQEPTPSPEARL